MPGESLILINPRRRRRRHSKNARRSRRMPAALRRYWASRRGTRLANPRRRRRGRNPVVRGYRRRYARATRPRYGNPRRRFRMRWLRNPRGDLMHTLGASLIGAGGALALNAVYGYVSPYLPTSLQTGLAQTAVLGVGALGIGYLVSRFVSKDIGDDVAFGGLTVVIYNAAASMAQSAGLPINTANLSGYGDYTPRRMGAYLRGTPNTSGFTTLGAYLKGNPRTSGFRGLGYVSPAPVLRPALGAYMKNAPMNVASAAGNWGDGM